MLSTRLRQTEVSGDTDPNFANVSLLLHMDGTNGSTTFTDKSNNALTVTANGNVSVSTTQSKFGGSSATFDGAGDYLTLSSSTPFAFGTGDFTVEFWLYLNSNSVTYLIYDSRPSGLNGLYPTIYYDASSSRINYYTNTGVRISGNVATASGAWHHIALSKSGTSTRLFINGTQSGATYTDSNNYLSGTGRPTIGADGNSLGSNGYNGYMDELRVTKGVARYTANFTAPTAAFPDS